MKFAIFSLVTLLAFAKSKVVKDLTNESSVSKRMADRASELSQALLGTIQIIKHNNDPYTRQFAVLYLHASGVDSTLRLDFGDDPSTALPDPFIIHLPTKKTYVWPAEDTTNLAVGTIARKGLQGHSEYFVLSKLAAMLEYFRGRHQQACPTYIVIATRLAPCYRTYNPPPAGCTLEIITKFNQARDICPHPATRYVVGYNQVLGEYVDDWALAEPLLTDANIIVRQVNTQPLQQDK